MFELSGKYGEAKVFTDVVDNESISQVMNLLNQPYVEGSKIRMMPDIHAGAGCTIGTTMTIDDKVCPNLVGVDIGCGMLVAKIAADSIDFEKLDTIIREHVPSGFSIFNTKQNSIYGTHLENLKCINHIDLERAYKSIGTLGGGNHFIEVDIDDSGNYYLVIHSGSRHLGVEVANYYQELAYKSFDVYTNEEIKIKIEELKSTGNEKLISDAIKEIKAQKPKIPKELAYVQGALFDDYIHDTKIVQEFAWANRIQILCNIAHYMDWNIREYFQTIHNYIDTDSMILRKGAVSAKSGERLIIPLNMRDGSLICIGKGNPDWNYSAPHGAGRIMSRSAAKDSFTLDEFKNSMHGIYSTSVLPSTIDECPMVYKNADDIINNICDTVTIETRIKPVYNFKAS